MTLDRARELLAQIEEIQRRVIDLGLDDSSPLVLEDLDFALSALHHWAFREVERLERKAMDQNGLAP